MLSVPFPGLLYPDKGQPYLISKGQHHFVLCPIQDYTLDVWLLYKLYSCHFGDINSASLNLSNQCKLLGGLWGHSQIWTDYFSICMVFCLAICRSNVLQISPIFQSIGCLHNFHACSYILDQILCRYRPSKAYHLVQVHPRYVLAGLCLPKWHMNLKRNMQLQILSVCIVPWLLMNS